MWEIIFFQVWNWKSSLSKRIRYRFENIFFFLTWRWVEINLVILLTRIRIRINESFWIRIQWIRIHITASNISKYHAQPYICRRHTTRTLGALEEGRGLCEKRRYSLQNRQGIHPKKLQQYKVKCLKCLFKIKLTYWHGDSQWKIGWKKQKKNWKNTHL